jgi:hypothetical protein
MLVVVIVVAGGVNVAANVLVLLVAAVAVVVYNSNDRCHTDGSDFGSRESHLTTRSPASL